MAIWQFCANLLIPNCLRSNLSYSPLPALGFMLLMLYLCFLPYDPKKRSFNTGEIFLLYYIKVLFSL